jgi:hypothetical protein
MTHAAFVDVAVHIFIVCFFTDQFLTCDIKVDILVCTEYTQNSFIWFISSMEIINLIILTFLSSVCV